jgi:hypothetical protein
MFLSSIFLSAFRTNPSTLPRQINNPSYGQALNSFPPVRSGVHNDLGNLVLGHVRLFSALLFAPLRLCAFA